MKTLYALFIFSICLSLKGLELDNNESDVDHSFINSNSNNPSHAYFCGTDQVQAKQLQNDPIFQLNLQNADKQWAAYVQNPTNHSENETLYNLPVVVHIIHNNGDENISDNQVYQAIQYINEAFANLNDFDQDTGVDTQIQFCLAERTPDNLNTSGILRVQSPLTELITDQDLEMKNLSRWDPTQYINIWVIKEACFPDDECGVVGYAYLPGSHGTDKDGIVIEAEYFGETPGETAAMVHELGHYLGLYHTFQNGCYNANCLLNGDKVCDTPPDQSTAPVPCNGNVNTCTTDTHSGFSNDQEDMFWNYMDYGDVGCFSAFTQGQTDRMTFFLEGLRKSLVHSKGCLKPCPNPIQANFEVPVLEPESGSTLNFTNTSQFATNFEWLIDGSVFSNAANASYFFNELGAFEITLIATNDEPGCYATFSQTIVVNCSLDPNFTFGNTIPQPLETVLFQATSSSSNMDWTVNGALESDEQTLLYTFPQPGVYDICLTLSNAFCEKKHCQQLYVFDQSSNCQSPSFAKILGSTNDGANCIIPSGDGNFYVAGFEEKKSVFLKVDFEGNVIWARRAQISLDVDKIAEIFIDSEGMLVGCGYAGVNSLTYRAFAFRYDPEADEFIWVQRYASKSRGFTILEPIQGGNFYMFSNSWTNVDPGGDDDFIMVEMDRQTGEIADVSTNFHAGIYENMQVALAHENYIYVVGTQAVSTFSNSKNPFVVKLDLSGNVIWSKRLQTVKGTAFDAIIDGNSLLLGIEASNFSGNHNLWLASMDLAGNLEWIRSNHFFGQPVEMIAVENDLIFYGSSLLKTDKTLNPIWHRSPFGSSNVIAQNQITEAGGYLFFVSGVQDIQIMKADPFGRIAKGCFQDRQLYSPNAQTSNFQAFGWTKYPSPTTMLPKVIVETETIDLPESIHCKSDCNTTCSDTFLKTYSKSGLNVKSTSMLNLGTGAFLIGGTLEDSTLLVLMDDQGKMLKQWTFDFLLGDEFLRKMILTSDGFVFGMGDRGQDYDDVGFSFKFDYLNEELVFHKRYNFGFGARLEDVTEKTPGDHFIIVGRKTSLNPAEEGFTIVAHKTTGQITNLSLNRSYLNHQFADASFKSIERMNGGFLVGGAFRTQNLGKQHIMLTELDQSGDPIWTKVHNGFSTWGDDTFVDDFLIENGTITYLAYEISDFGAFMYKLVQTDQLGNPLWYKNYNLAGSSTNFPYQSKLLQLSDGYLIVVQANDNSSTITKTDLNGDWIWSRELNLLSPISVSIYDDAIFFAGSIYVLNFNDGHLAFGKMTLDGEIIDDCDLVEEYFPGITLLNLPDVVPVTWENIYNITPGFENSFASLVPTSPFETQNQCFDICLEYCDNQIDDDGDGLIDSFDPDCNCTVSLDCGALFYRQCFDMPCEVNFDFGPGKFQVDTLWETPYSFLGKSPSVGDVDGDCIPDVVFCADELIKVVDGRNGEVKYQFNWEVFSDFINGDVRFTGTPAIGDVDLDGQVEIFTTCLISSTDGSEIKKISRFDYRPNEGDIWPVNWWFTSAINDSVPHSPSLANIDAFGSPEIYIGNQIFSSENGKELANGSDQNIGYFIPGSNALAASTVAADVLSPEECSTCHGLEIVAGNQVYASSIISYLSGEYNTMFVVRELSGFSDGATQLADFDGDGDLDAVVAVIEGAAPQIYIWDIQTETLIGNPFQGFGNATLIGKPTIGDVDGDSLVEIAVQSNHRLYILDDYQNGGGNNWGLSPNTILNLTLAEWELPYVSPTMFDFNVDGKNELLFYDESSFVIRDISWGPWGSKYIEWNTNNTSLLGNYPIVADINGDGFAEILLKSIDKLIALCPNFPIPRTRPVWNQFNYHITNVLDNGQIPFEQQNHHLAADGKLNGFLLQQSIYNHDSLVIFNTTDAVVTSIAGYCDGDSILVNMTVCNEGQSRILEKTPISIYEGDPVNSDAGWMSTVKTDLFIEPGGCVDLSFQIPVILNAPIFAVFNDAGTSIPPLDLNNSFPNTYLPECDYANNIEVFQIDFSPPILDLGPDTLLCDNGVVGLNAGSDFLQYQWQDGSEDSIFTTWVPGTYWVEVTDSCGGIQRDTVLIEMEVAPDLIVNGDTIICPGVSIELAALPIFEKIQWFPKELMECDTCLSNTVFPDTSIYVYAVGSTQQGCVSVDTIFVEVVELEIAYETTLSCDGAADGSIFVYPEGGALPYSFQWQNFSGSTPEIHNLLPGAYFLTVEDANGCVNTASIILEQTNTEAIDFTIEHVSCFGAADGLVMINTPNEHYKVSFLDSEFRDELVFGNLSSGNYTLSVLDTNDCITTEAFTIESPPELLLQLPDDLTLNLGESFQINAITNASQNAQYQWQTFDYLDCSNCPDPIAAPLTTTLYLLKVTEETGCQIEDKILITIQNQGRIYIPNVFSPNGDGLNDVFYPFAAPEVLLINQFQIYDRWGAMIFETQNFIPNDAQYGWDGTFEGKPMNAGVFVYVLEVAFLDGSQSLLKGDVVLVR